MAKNKVEIGIEATDNASRTMGQVAEAIKRTDQEAGKARQGLASLGQQAFSAATTGKLNFEALASSLVGIVPIAGAVAAAIAGINAATSAAKDWFLTVDQFSDITGIGMEASSVFATGIEMAGANAQRVGTSFAMLNQRLDDEARAANAASVSTGKLGTQLARLNEDHAQRAADAAESLAERLSDLGAQRVDAERDSARRIAGYERDLYDMRRRADLDRLERAKAVARQIADLDTDAAEERMAIESMFAGADTALGRRARAAELAALEQRTGAKRARIQEEERDANDAAERELQMRQQAVQEQIALEREAYAERLAAFDKMQAKIEAAAEKAAEREAKQYARQMEDLAAASAAASATAAAAANSTSAAMQRLGIDMEKYMQATPLERYTMLVDALNNVGLANDDLQQNMDRNGWPDSMKAAMVDAQGETAKSKAAMELFGRYSAGEWLDTIRIVKQEGWDGLIKSAQDYNRTIGPDHAAATQQFIDNEKKRELAAKGTAMTIGNILMGYADLFLQGDPTMLLQSTGQATTALNTLANSKDMTEFFNNLAHALFGGGRALGGPVEAGMPYLVGERGPELFMPRQAGTVVNNWTYSPTYGGAPGNEPGASFALMRAMAGA